MKLEVDESFGPLVRRMTRAGIPVIAHLGSRPQTVRQTGGYRAAARLDKRLRGLGLLPREIRVRAPSLQNLFSLVADWRRAA